MTAQSEGANTGMNVQHGQAPLAACAPESVLDSMRARLVAQADVNEDGRLSREEVETTTNLLVGGFFFAADADGDGVVSVEEGRAARKAVLQRSPALESVLSAARETTGANPLASIARLLDLEYGEPLTRAEARKTAQNVSRELFAAVDRNRDGSLTQDELRRAETDAAASLGRSAFAAADRNSDGQLSVDELKEAFVQSTQAVFKLSDSDNNGKLSERESAAALRAIAQWYGEARGAANPDPAGTSASPSSPASTGTLTPASGDRPGTPAPAGAGRSGTPAPAGGGPGTTTP